MYEQVRAEIGDESADGFVVNVVTKTEGGLRHLNVWESREHWEAFRDQRVQPAVAAVLARIGVPVPDGPIEEHVLDLVAVGHAG